MNPHIDAVALLPEFTLTALIALVFVADLVLGNARKGAVSAIAAVGLLIPFVSTVALGIADHSASMTGGAYFVDDFALLGKGLFLASALVVLMFGAPQQWKGEYIVLLLASTLGMVMVVSSRDLLTFFVSFELLAIPGYLLAGWNKRSRFGHEAALKYYLLGVLATAVMLYGLSLLFGLAGSTKFDAVSQALAGGGDQLPLARIAVFFVIVGMAFKVSAVPFHFWAPDAYEGAPIPVAAFLSVASKAAGLLALVEFVAVAFPEASSVWAPVLYVLAITTMTAGNLIALRQTDMIRLLAYSSIAQAGYMLVPLAVTQRYGGSIELTIQTVFQFLLIYSAMNLGAFAVVQMIARRTGSTAISSLRNLFTGSPALAVAFTVFLLSLAGIPPFGGWYAKLVIFRSAIEADGGAALALAAVVAVNSAIGLAYYARLIRHMWATSENPAEPVNSTRSTVTAIAVSMMLIAVVVSGVLPGVVTYIGGVSSLGR